MPLVTFKTIPPIGEMTSDQLADLLDAVQIERFRRRNDPPPEWHLKILKERENSIANGSADSIDISELKDSIERRTRRP